MLLSEKVTLVITLWILLVLLFTNDTDLELFFVLIFIGVLILRALTDVYITTTLKHRMNLFISLFIIIFMVIVGNKIITILAV
jgi:hypothetical protein